MVVAVVARLIVAVGGGGGDDVRGSCRAIVCGGDVLPTK